MTTILGVLYPVLAVATIVLWARTNGNEHKLNLWRYYLAMLAVSGVLFLYAPELWVVVAAFAAFVAGACAHLYHNGRWNDSQHRSVTIAFVAGLCLIALLCGASLISAAVVVLGLFFTYTSVGQQWFNAAMSELRG